MNSNLIKISTAKMTHEDWLEARRGSEGGSDAATVLGLNPYRSAYNLWLEKTGRVIPEDISDREAVRLGNDLEDYVAKRFAEETGKKVRKTAFIYKNPDYPFAHANPDRLIVGENAGLECKTSSSFDTVKQCRNGFPEKYYAQCVHYMMVTGADRWYLAVACFGSGFYTYCLERDEAEIAALADAEARFWDLVERDEPPEIDGSDSTAEGIRALYSESDGTVCDLTGVSDALQLYAVLASQIKDLTSQQDEAKNAIMAYMGNADTGLYEGYKVTWKSQSRESFDKKKFAADHPELVADYISKSESRVFRFSGAKK